MRLITLITVAVATVFVGGEARSQCPPDQEVSDLVWSLGASSNLEDVEALSEYGSTAACHLIEALHVVEDFHIVGYLQAERPEEMRVVWALRALSYMTGCQNFEATTSEDPDTWETLRRSWVLRTADGSPLDEYESSTALSFFQTWMSRDSVFLAPLDTQQAIIDQWHQWYAEHGDDPGSYSSCELTGRWYF